MEIYRRGIAVFQEQPCPGGYVDESKAPCLPVNIEGGTLWSSVKALSASKNTRIFIPVQGDLISLHRMANAAKTDEDL